MKDIDEPGITESITPGLKYLCDRIEEGKQQRARVCGSPA
jgi:hypothetical protein